MDKMDKIQIKLGRNLKAIRNSRGLSLDKVSEMTGVSKAMLAQIERGDSNPSISIIWKIANGLRLSFSSLIEEQPAETSIVTIDDADPFVEAGGAFRSYALFPFNPHKKFEVFLVDMDPHSAYESEAHTAGVEEYVMLVHGSLIVAINGLDYRIENADSLRFVADLPHTYRNPAETPLRFYSIIYYP